MVWFVQIRTAEERHKAPFYENRAAQGFLADEASNQLFISGLKGVGKTLLLGHKSAALRNSHEAVSFVPMNDLVETFTSTPLSLSIQERDKLSNYSNWQIIWRTALAVVVLKRAEVRLSDEIARKFADCGQSLSVMAHVRSIILGNLVPEIDQHLPRLSANLEALLGQVQSAVYIFLDAIDELVVAHSGEFLRRYKADGAVQYGHLSQDVWTAAQIGFVKAALDIHNNHKHIRIYGAIRTEAIEHYRASDLQNLEPRILRIRYSTDDLKRMFTQKLDQLWEQSPQLFKTRTGSIVQRFLGFSHFVHPTVRTPQRKPLEEEPLDYIIRHTRGRPRELDELGKAIETIAVEDRTERSIRERVRIRSSDFYNWAISEALPYWRPEYDKLIETFHSNWITRAELRRLIKKLGPDITDETARELFKTGLLGCTKRGLGDGDCELRFRQFDPMAPIDAGDFDDADFYALHPCVNIATFHHKHERYQPDPWNVAGHGRPYIHVKGHGHVHLGAGALGLGCAVPLLTADTGLGVCVMQRPSGKWVALAQRSAQPIKLRLKYLTSDAVGTKGPEEIEFTWLDETIGRTKLTQLIADWTRGERHLFYVGQLEATAAKAILKEARSVSTAVRGTNLETLVDPLSATLASGVRIYPFENDELAVKAFRKALTGRKLEVVDVCVDRICLPVEISHRTLTVNTEAYQRVIVLDNTPEAAQLFAPPASGNTRNVVVVNDATKYIFLRTRKRMLVNGIHFFFALAAYALARQIYGDTESPEIAFANATPLFGRTPEVRDTVMVCNRLFALSLLSEAEDSGFLKTREDVVTLSKDIEAQQAEVLDRLLTMPDNLWRILNTEDGNALFSKARLFLKKLSELKAQLARARVVQSAYPQLDLKAVEQDVAMLKNLFLAEVLQER